MATSTTSANAAQNSTKLHLAVSKLPTPKLSGNKIQDDDRLAKHNLLLRMVNDCLADESLILPLYNTYTAQVAERLQRVSKVATHNEQFTKLSVFGKLDDSFVINFLVKRSDLTMKDVVEAMKHDPEAHHQLLEHEVQLNPMMQCVDQLRVKDVCQRFLSAQGDKVLAPLATFKARDGVLDSGALNWLVGCYMLTFENDLVAKVTFRNGDTVACTTPISRDYSLVMNWSDWRAAFRRAPFPDVKLHVLFSEKKIGPYKLPKPMTSRGKDYAKAVAEAFTAWEAEKVQMGQGAEVEVAIEAAQNELAKVNKSKKDESLKRAGEMVAKTLADKRKRQTISLKA